MKNTTVPLTLQALIKQKIIDKGLSRSQLVSAIGYSNISNGCRKLTTFTSTLNAPSDEFIANLTSVLEIDPLTFYRAFQASLDQFSTEAKRKFKPSVEIILGIQIRPLFAYCAVKNMCVIPVPEKLQSLPLSDEIEGIVAIFENQVATVLNDNLRKHVIGFNYNREHNSIMQFDAEFTLKETVFIQPRPTGKILFGNRVIDMLSGGMG